MRKMERRKKLDRDRLDGLEDLYQVGLLHKKRFFDSAHHIFNFTFIGVGAIIAWSTQVSTLQSYQLIYFYILPIYMLVAGTAYFYAFAVMGKAEQYLIELEQKQKRLSNVSDIDGW